MDPHLNLFRGPGSNSTSPVKYNANYPVAVRGPPHAYMERFPAASLEEASSTIVPPGTPTSPWGAAYSAPLSISIGSPPPIAVLPPISVGAPMPGGVHSPARAHMPLGPYPGQGSPLRLQPPIPSAFVPSPQPPQLSPPRRAAPLTGLPGCISQAHKLLNQLDEDFQVATSKILHMQRTNPVLTPQVLAKLAFSCALSKPPSAACYAQFVMHLRAWIKESERGSFEEEMLSMVRESFEKLLPAMSTWSNADVGQHSKVLLGSMQFLGEICMEGLVAPERVEEVLTEVWPSPSASVTECGIRVKMTCTLLGIVMPKYDKPLLRQHLVALKRLAEAKPNPFIGFLVDKLLEDARQKVQWFGVAGIPNSGGSEREDSTNLADPDPEPEPEPEPEEEPEPECEPPEEPAEEAKKEVEEEEEEEEEEGPLPELPAHLPPPPTWQELHAKRLKPSPSMMSEGLSWPTGDEVPGMAFDPEMLFSDKTPRSGLDPLGTASSTEEPPKEELPNAAASASW
eukprot:EG_transcript_1416